MDQLLDIARVPVTFTPDLGVMQGGNPCYVVCCAVRCHPCAVRCHPPAVRCDPPAVRCDPPAVRCHPPTTASAGFARFTVSRTKDDGSRLGISTVGGPSRLFAVGGERRPGKSMCRRIGNSAMDVPSHLFAVGRSGDSSTTSMALRIGNSTVDVPSHLLAHGPAASRWVVARSERIAGMRSASDPQDR
jgi:hypothetical protein